MIEVNGWPDDLGVSFLTEDFDFTQLNAIHGFLQEPLPPNSWAWLNILFWKALAFLKAHSTKHCAEFVLSSLDKIP